MSSEIELLLLNVNRPCPVNLSKRQASPHTANAPRRNFGVYLEHDFSSDFDRIQPVYSAKFSCPLPPPGNPLSHSFRGGVNHKMTSEMC